MIKAVSENKAIKSVAIFGCSCGEAGDEHYENARLTAFEIAKSGRTIVNGGGPGVMLASTLGAKEADGKVKLVYYKPELASQFEGGNTDNIADESYEEANYILRTKKLLELADIYVIFNGGTGTISEFAMAWGVARLYIDHHKPLILFGKFWHEIMNVFKKNMLVREDEYTLFSIVESPEEAMKEIEKYDKKLQETPHKHIDCVGPECKLRL